MVGSMQREFHQFSRENWWVYVVLVVCLILIYLTNSGSIIEIFLVFVVYVAADLCMMNMITLMEQKNYKVGSLFQLLGNVIFTFLFVYHFFHSGQLQYLLWSVGFILGAVKNISKYHFFDAPMNSINGISLFILNTGIFLWAYSFLWDVTFQVIFQACGWIFFSSSLVVSEKYNSTRYFMGLIWLVSMVVWAGIGLWTEFWNGSIYGVTLCYFLLPVSVLVVYLKTLRNYL